MLKPTDENMFITDLKDANEAGESTQISYAPSAAEECSPCGKSDKRIQCGVVSAVGPGYKSSDGKRTPPDYKVGEKVFIDGTTGTKITHNGKEHYLIRSYHVIAKAGNGKAKVDQYNGQARRGRKISDSAGMGSFLDSKS